MPTENVFLPALNALSPTYWAKRRTWVRTANYKSIPRYALPINNYDFSLGRMRQDIWPGYKYRSYPNGSWVYVYENIYVYDGTLIEYFEGQYLNYINIGSYQEGCRNRAMIDALNKASEMKINLAVALAEAEKTADLILSTANRIDRAYRAFRRGKYKEVASLLEISPKKVHSTWLKHQYGVQPLLMDVRGAAEFFAQQTLGRATKFAVKGKLKLDVNQTRSSTETAYGGPWVTVDTVTGTVEARVKLWLEVTSSKWATAQQLGITNPALFVWELVPYSFVFDWFISVGDYLTACSALDGITVRKSMRELIRDVTYTRSNPGSNNISGGTEYWAGPRYASIHSRDYIRDIPSVDTSLLYPPRNNNALGFRKLVTSLALIRARWGGSSFSPNRSVISG